MHYRVKQSFVHRNDNGSFEHDVTSGQFLHNETHPGHCLAKRDLPAFSKRFDSVHYAILRAA